MKLWIIGKQGMLARAFRRICSEKGIDFVATSQKEVNLLDRDSVEAQFDTLDFTHVINCAAYTAVDRAEKEREAAYDLNVTGVEHLATFSALRGNKLIHFSTDYVFDGKKSSPYDELTPTRPLSVYGKTKQEGEEVLFTHYPNACLIRTSWLFGREGNHFPKKMTDLMQTRDTLRIVNDQIGRPTYCDDLVEATLDLLDMKGIFHFANREELSFFEWAEEIRRRLEEKEVPLLCQELKPILTAQLSGAAIRPLYSVLGTEKYEEKTGKIPRSFKEGLAECLRKIDVKRSC